MSTELNWFKSSYSGSGGDNCIEIAIVQRASHTTWSKSSYSGDQGDNCIEVALRPTAVHVRDSKDTTRAPFTVAPDAWAAFTAYARR
ncbi:DUF397 domain-containing protein [Streptomyces sp. NPDC060194]|uniref:DUF397 domain-containing protein n=1 Tax=Streptomyces sp. NPDC060194 TaxID=3347069 RepID=UPI0036575903